MARPRKYFFIQFSPITVRATECEIGGLFVLADTVKCENQTFKIVKIHPRKGGVTAVKV